MTRQININRLQPGDRAYLEQRPWLIEELKTQTGKSFDELDFPENKYPKEGEADGQENATLPDSEELKKLRRENANLEQAIEDMRTAHKGQIEELEGRISDLRDQLDDETLPYTEWDYEDLVKEAKSREIELTSRSKDSVIKALEAWDEAHPAEDETGETSAE